MRSSKKVDLISLHVEDRTKCFQCQLSRMVEREFPEWSVEQVAVALIETLALIAMDADSPDGFVTAVCDDLKDLMPQCRDALLTETICEASKHKEGEGEP